jgi:predicted O-methyltransferase YrrM
MVALAGREIDFLFIDGDHTYEGVKSDFEMYSPLVRAGGLVAFHDIVPDRFETTGEVHIYWNELKQRGYEQRELIDLVGSRGYGIGVVFLGGPS